MKRTLFSFIGAAGLMLATSGAQAAIITYSATMPATATDFTLPISLNGFDTLGGTRILQSAVLTLTGSMTSTIGVENTSVSSGVNNVTARTSGTLTYTGVPVGATNVVNLNVLGASSVNLAVFDGLVNYAGASGFTFAALTATASNILNYSLPADLSFFTGIGAGTFAMNVASFATSGTTAGGNAATQIVTTGFGNASIVYTYVTSGVPPVPTPGTLALLGLGLIGLTVMRRKAML